MPHEHDYTLSRTCGVEVCGECRDHKGLARCFCGWAASGGDGYQELVEMGETIEEDGQDPAPMLPVICGWGCGKVVNEHEIGGHGICLECANRLLEAEGCEPLSLPS